MPCLRQSLPRKSRTNIAPCIHRQSLNRASSSTALPPESPRYIDVPRPPQFQGYDRPDVKGVLPIPRQLLRSNSKRDKTDPEFLAEIAPGKTSPKYNKAVVPPEAREYVTWKSRQTDLRRQNLKESLVTLIDRQRKSDRWKATRQRERQAARRAAVEAPEREDDRLTSPSVIQPIRQDLVKAGVDYAELQARQDRLAAVEAAKAEERRMHLHTLYMNAKDFILTETALNKKVDEVFDEPFYKQNPGASIWDHEYMPETIDGILKGGTRSGRGAIAANEGHIQIMKERLNRIAEELTGGKM